MENQNDLEKILENTCGGINEKPINERAEEVANMNKDVNQQSCNFDLNQYKKTENTNKRVGFMKKLLMVTALGAMFGIVAGAAFIGVQNFLSFRGFQQIVVENKNVELGAAELVTPPDGEIISTSISTVAQSVMPSVVSITNLSVQEVDSFFFGTQKYESESAGSGIIIGKNEKELLIVTNNHVIEGNTKLTVTFIDNESVEAIVKGTDADIDIAVLAVKISELKTETIEKIKVASLGNSKQLIVGEPAIAIGNALGYGQSVTSGIISAVQREMDDFDTTLIQTDAAINPGNSGGALLNIKGEVIGINTAKVAADAVEGMGYAIPISEVKEVLTEMMNKETREKVPAEKRGKLGISCVTVDETAILYYNMPKGAYINEVTEESAAAKAGLSKGTIITKFDGNSISSSTALVDLLAYYEIGETVTMEVAVPKSDGTYETKEVSVTLQAATE